MLEIKFTNWTLAKQILVSTVVILIISILVTGELLRNSQTKDLIQSVRAKTEKTINMLSSTILDDMITEDIPRLETIANQLTHNFDEIAHLHIENEEKRTLLQWGGNKDESIHSKKYLNHDHHVIYAGEYFGLIHISVDMTKEYQQIEKRVHEIQLLISLTQVVLALAMLFLTRSMVIIPIKKISDRVHQFSQGNFEEVQSLESSHEISLLSEAISEHARVLKLQEKYKNELQIAKVRAEAANQAKTEFLSGISHEMRTPINAVTGFADLLLNDPDEPPSDYQKDSLNEINEAGKQLNGLIENILELVSIDNIPEDIELEEVNVCDAIQMAAETVNNLAIRNKITLNNNTANCNSTMVLGRLDWLTKIFSHLLKNAILYNVPGGSVTIQTEALPGYFQLEIADTGIGIPVEDQASIFEPFVRLDESHTLPGAGIGLTVSQRLLELMEGDIGVVSQSASGSVFWVRLKLSEHIVGQTTNS